ncbi:MAG: hypothetical protein PHS54_00065 [Clostridia bacterium]|nr:hypothetical protein [Clostridia bacterium]
MEVRIAIGDKTWIVPSNAVQSLISWLTMNAVEMGNGSRQIREVNKGESDSRQLIVEN